MSARVLAHAVLVSFFLRSIRQLTNFFNEQHMIAQRVTKLAVHDTTILAHASGAGPRRTTCASWSSVDDSLQPDDAGLLAQISSMMHE